MSALASSISGATSPTLFFKTEKETSIHIDGGDQNSIKQLIQTEKQKNLPLGYIEKINFVQTNGSSTTNVTTANLLTQLKAAAPDSLVRTLSQNYLFGIYAYNSQKDSFFLVNVDSYDQAYAGMIAWENTLRVTFGGLFINPIVSTAPTTNVSATIAATSTTTASSTIPQGEPVFIDKVIDNRDTRVLVDGQGNVEMIYTFVDSHTLLIASSVAMFREVINRLTNGLIVR